MLDGQKELEMKAPNGAVYRFSTNAIDDKTFNQFKNKLEDAAKNKNQAAFDQVWKELTGSKSLMTNMEEEFNRMQNRMQQIFQETSPFFKGQFSLLNNPIFSEPKALSEPNTQTDQSEEAINKQIQKYQQKIEELQKKKNAIDSEKRKLQINEEINNKKTLMDTKLDEFAKNLDNDNMKKKLTEEMTKLNAEIKQLETELQNLNE